MPFDCGSATTIMHSQNHSIHTYIWSIRFLRPSTIKTTHPAQCNFSAAIDYLLVRFLWMMLCLSDMLIYVFLLFFFYLFGANFTMYVFQTMQPRKTPSERMIVVQRATEKVRQTDKVRRLPKRSVHDNCCHDFNVKSWNSCNGVYSLEFERDERCGTKKNKCSNLIVKNGRTTYIQMRL